MKAFPVLDYETWPFYTNAPNSIMNAAILRRQNINVRLDIVQKIDNLVNFASLIEKENEQRVADMST